MRHIDIVFDGPPSHESGRFVEVEDATGASIGDFGEWVERDDKYWALRVPDNRPPIDENEPLTYEFKHNLGFLPDDSGAGDLFLKIWLPGEPDSSMFEDDGFEEYTHLYLCDDGEYGFESYDKVGKSLAIITVGKVTTRGELWRLLVGLKHENEGQHANPKT